MDKKKLILAPAKTPINLAEFKEHLKIELDVTVEDAMLQRMINAATEQAQGLTGRALITQTWEYYIDRWPLSGQIELPLPPLQSVSSIKYTDVDGNESTFDAASYSVDNVSYIGRVVLNAGYSWPSVNLNNTNPIKITLIAGYGDDETDVPQTINQAILLLAANLYEYRDMFITGTIISDVPYSATALLAQYDAKGL